MVQESLRLRFASGERFGRYVIERILGEGAMGVIILARDAAIDRQVAIKILAPNQQHSEQAIARFYREIKVLAQIDHPNILRVFDYGCEDETHYYAMEYVEGQDLKAMLGQAGVSLEEKARIIARCARALAAAHKAGIVHRDIKPANIMLSKEGVPKLADFGLARIDAESEASLTQAGELIGTPVYMPPEQAMNAKDARAASDIYSLGATLYHLVTRHPPYDGETARDVLIQILTTPPPDPRGFEVDLPDELFAVLSRSMAQDPTERYPSADDLAKDLENFAGGRLVAALDAPQTVTWKGEGPSAASRGGSSLALVLLLFVVILGGGAFFGREFLAPRAPAPVQASPSFDFGVVPTPELDGLLRKVKLDPEKVRAARLRFEEIKSEAGIEPDFDAYLTTSLKPGAEEVLDSAAAYAAQKTYQKALDELAYIEDFDDTGKKSALPLLARAEYTAANGDFEAAMRLLETMLTRDSETTMQSLVRVTRGRILNVYADPEYRGLALDDWGAVEGQLKPLAVLLAARYRLQTGRFESALKTLRVLVEEVNLERTDRGRGFIVVERGRFFDRLKSSDAIRITQEEMAESCFLAAQALVKIGQRKPERVDLDEVRAFLELASDNAPADKTELHERIDATRACFPKG